MRTENSSENFLKIDELKNLSKSEIRTEVNKLNNWIKDYSDVFKNAEWYLYKYIKKVQSALNEDWRGDDERAYKSLSKLKDSIRISKEKQKDSIWTSNEHLQRMVNEVVDRIDNAENEMFEILKANKEQSYMKKQNEAIEKRSGKKFFEFDQKNNQYTFTEASNTPKIHEVLKYFFKDDKNVYTIDYSNCKNENIKKKMIDALWGTAKCSIKYNSDKWTYNLINESWEISQRALIWEGVTLKTAKAGAYEAKVKQKAEAEKLATYNESTFIGSQKYKALEESMWDTLKSKINTTTDRVKFMIETEQRLDKIIKTQKKRWWELENWEPVSRINFRSGLMEIHFINKEGLKEDITLWEDEKQLWKKLYDILDDNEGAYKNYLTMRIKEKWNEADRFSRRSQVFVWTKNIENNPSLQKEIENFTYWLGLIAKLVDKINDEDGTTKEVAALKVAVRNYLYSLENTNPSQEEMKKAKQNIWDLFVKYKSNDWSWSRMSDSEAKSMISTILSNDRVNAQRAVRELWSKLNIFGNTKTTFLRDEIWENKDIWFNKKGYTEAFRKISEELDFWENDPRMDEKIQLIDGLYNNSWDNESVFKFLKEKKLLPAELAFSDEGVEDACKKIKGVLDTRKNSIKNLNYGPNEFKANQEKEILRLEAKGNAITDEERVRLQSLRILLENPELMKEQIANAKQQAEFAIKYGDIAPMIRGSLAFALAKNGDGMKWTNADIFNSSYWLNGRYDFSDETAVLLWEAGKMIIEEVAIAAVAIAAGSLTGGAWAVAVYALRAAMTWAKIARIANKTSKIKRIFSAAKYYRQIWKNTEKAIQSAKLAKKAVNSAKNIEKAAKATKAIEKWSNTVKLLGVGNRVAEAGKTIEKWSNAVKLLGVGNRVAEAGKVIKTVDHIDDISKVGTLTKLAAKTSNLVFDSAGYHVTNTILRNALNGETLTEWLWDLKGYIHSMAFLWILKAIGGPLQNITGAGVKKILGEKYAANTLWKALQWITSIGAELWGLMLAEQGISLVFDQKLSEITGEGIVQSLGLILGLRAYGRGKMKIKNWRTSASGKLQDVTIEWENGEVVKVDPNWKVIESNVPAIIKGTDILNKKGKTQQKKIDTSKTEQKQIEAHKTEQKQIEAEKQTELEINENDSQSVKNIKAEINNAINELKKLEIQDNLYKSKRSKIKKEKLDTFDELIRLNKDAITKRRQEIQDLKAKLRDQLKGEGKATQWTPDNTEKMKEAVLDELQKISWEKYREECKITLNRYPKFDINTLKEIYATSKGAPISLNKIERFAKAFENNQARLQAAKNAVKLFGEELSLENIYKYDYIKTTHSVSDLNTIKELLTLSGEAPLLNNLQEAAIVLNRYPKLDINTLKEIRNQTKSPLKLEEIEWFAKVAERNYNVDMKTVNELLKLTKDPNCLSKIQKYFDVAKEFPTLWKDMETEHSFFEGNEKETNQNINFMQTMLKNKSKLWDLESSLIKVKLSRILHKEGVTGFKITDELIKKIFHGYKNGQRKNLTQYQNIENAKSGLERIKKNIWDEKIANILVESGILWENFYLLAHNRITLTNKTIKRRKQSELQQREQDLNTIREIIWWKINNIREYIERLSKNNGNEVSKAQKISNIGEIVGKKMMISKLENLMKKIENEADPKMLRELIKLEDKRVDKNKGINKDGELDPWIGSETLRMYNLVLENNSFNFREFISRSKEYLKNNEQLSKEDFDQLFKWPEKGWKYWYIPVKQKYLWYCYAYAGFELMQRSGVFESLIRTSLKKTPDGQWWEVRIPLGSKDGHIIKVANSELNQPYLVPRGSPTKLVPVSVNSNGSKGMKILEIAFIKESILSTRRLTNEGRNNLNNIEIDEGFIKQYNLSDKHINILKWRMSGKDFWSTARDARESYKKTGDFKLMSEHIVSIQGGVTNNFIEMMMGKEIISKKVYTEENERKILLQYANLGNIKITISAKKDWGEIRKLNLRNPKGGEKTETLDFRAQHAYPINRIFTDAWWNQVVEFRNPRESTPTPYKVELNELIKNTDEIDVAYVNTNKLFK